MRKYSVKDGSSLLYDIKPYYIAFNLGNISLQEDEPLEKYELIKREGRFIQGKFLLVNILRNTNIEIFKIIAFNNETGEEFILNLEMNDLRE